MQDLYYQRYVKSVRFYVLFVPGIYSTYLHMSYTRSCLVCTYAGIFMCIRIYSFIFILTSVYTACIRAYAHVCIYVCVYIYMDIHMYVYMYIDIHTYTFALKGWVKPKRSIRQAVEACGGSQGLQGFLQLVEFEA